MTAEQSTIHSRDEATARREFLKQVGKAVATAPAIALLLAASSKPASALNGPVYGPQDICSIPPCDAGQP